MTSVTERSIYVSLSIPVIVDRLTKVTPLKPGMRQFYVNGPLHAFDRLSGEYQWTQPIENRVFPIDQPRDVPIVIFADLWDETVDDPSKKRKSFFNLPDPQNRSRYLCLDARSGKVLLDLLGEERAKPWSSGAKYAVGRDLTKGVVDLLVDRKRYSFNYSPPAAQTK